MSKLGKFPLLSNYQKRFLWTHEEVDRAAHPVVWEQLGKSEAERNVKEEVRKAEPPAVDETYSF